jgi:hypothetical protein
MLVNLAAQCLPDVNGNLGGIQAMLAQAHLDQAKGLRMHAHQHLRAVIPAPSVWVKRRNIRQRLTYFYFEDPNWCEAWCISGIITNTLRKQWLLHSLAPTTEEQ